MKKILIIDDDELFCFLTQSILEKAGLDASVRTTICSQEAIATIKHDYEHNKLALPEVIFLDIMMPIFDGHAFLAAFDAMPDDLKQSTKIVMLSSSLDPEDISRAKRYPFVVDFIEKPLSKPKLSDLQRKF